MTTADDSEVTSSDDASLPARWRSTPGLVFGFGDRWAEPPPSTLLLATQVHGTRVVHADAAGATRDVFVHDDGLRRIRIDADALVAAAPGIVVGVRTADCVPVLLVAPRERWAAAVHAGWRGTLGGIVREAIRTAGEAGVDPAGLHAAIGPSIGPCCYEVSEDLVEQFRRADLPVAPGQAGRAQRHLDLRRINSWQLEACGVPPANIELVGPCTRCAHDRFHSYRADPSSGGRQVSWIGWE